MRIAICIVMILSSGLGYAEKKLVLTDLVKKAIKKNPELQAKETLLKVMKLRAPKFGVLDEPKLGISAMNITKDAGTELSISQTLPFPGKLYLREYVATKEADMVSYEYLEKRNEIKAKVKIAFYEFYFINKAIEITKKNKKLLEHFVEIAQAKYKVGKGLQSDVLRAQVELSKLINELILLNAKRSTAEARINTLLYDPPEKNLFPPEDIKKTKVTLNINDLKKDIFERPLLKAYSTFIERNKSALELAKKELYPDFTFSIDYSQIKNDISAMVTINLPFLWGRKTYEVPEFKERVNFSQSMYNDVKNEIYFSLRDLLAEIKKGERTLDLYENGILPQARQSLDSATSNYQVNKVDFLTLLENQMILYKYEIDYYRELSSYEGKIAQMELAIGKEFNYEKE